ncbi:hypothetical protein G991_04534 [Escherichia coli UMEA 3703-1]|nr:hypothetical protein G991_04534 [Escherichia coli UMEA 3703-1]
MERVPLKQTDRHHKSPGGDLCIRDSSPEGRGDWPGTFLDFVISQSLPLAGSGVLLRYHANNQHHNQPNHGVDQLQQTPGFQRVFY